jgi:hypothetical protein
MARSPRQSPDLARVSAPPREEEEKLDPRLRGDDEGVEDPPPTPSSEDEGASKPKNRRTTPRQATSAVAYEAEPPAPDDPLLNFAPVPHVAPRKNSITPDRQRAFIAALAASGIVTQAALEIGASLEALYKLRNRPGAEGFRAAWEAALDRGIARLEDCALARALEGEERPIVSGGKLLGWWTRYDNSLVQFLLRQRRPERYAPAEAGPGHPLYERIRAEVLAEVAAREAEEEARVFEEIDEFLDQMVERRKANAAILLEDQSGEDDS